MIELAPVEQNIEAPRTVSMGRLDKLDSCPHSYYLDVLYDGGAQSHMRATGAVFHEFAEQATNRMLEAGEPYYPGEVAREHIQSILLETEMVVPAHAQDALRGMAFNWGERHSQTIDLRSLIANERLLAIEIGGWTLRGRIDRAHISERTCFIYDYKTGLNIPSSQKLMEDFQLLFYPLLLAEGITVDREGNVLDDRPPAAGCNEFWPTLVFPRWITDEGRVLERSPMEGGQIVIRRREDLWDLKQSLLGLLKRLERGLETGIWPAASGSHCSRCPAQSKCPIPPELRELEECESIEEASTLGAAWERTNAVQKRRREAIKSFAGEHGAIPVGDKTFDFRLDKRGSTRFELR